MGEDGREVSHGERQLLVICRALVKSVKFCLSMKQLLMSTEKRIQFKVDSGAVLRQNCDTIAHRLETIMDSDRIIVMDEGRIKEFDTPRSLLENKESLLTKWLLKMRT